MMDNSPQGRRFRTARAAVGLAGMRLIGRCGLTGIGVGLKRTGGRVTDEPAVKAFVVRKKAPSELAPASLVPQVLSSAEGDVRSDVEEMQPLVAPARLTTYDETVSALVADRWKRRPVAGGQSVSHICMPIGTIAVRVRDSLAPGNISILSCNHVLGALNRGRPGDVVVQPAVVDGGATLLNQCGILSRFVPVVFGWGSSNLVDAAVAAVGAAWPWVDYLGQPRGVRSGNSLSPGAQLRKVGRTSALTAGEVVATSFMSWIPYPPIWGGGIAFFREQILASPMAAYGDSGSLVVDDQQRAVGLLFGGSGTHSVICDIVHVEAQLGVSVLTV
jgi:hypothetical protein